jgi:hypothetical protein
VPAGRDIELTPQHVRPSGRVVSRSAVEFESPDLPDNFPKQAVFISKPGAEMASLRVGVNIRKDGGTFAAVIDGAGRVLWWREAKDGYKPLRVRPTRDGTGIFYATEIVGTGLDDAYITRFDLRDQSEIRTRALQHHHDFVELPDGRLAWLSFAYQDGLLPLYGVVPMASDAIRVAEVGADAGDEEILFSLFDDSGRTPWLTCSHMFPDHFVEDRWEWSHSNSLDWDDEAQAFRMLIRYWDAVAQVGLDGDLDWIAGGEQSDFEAYDWFDHAHGSELSGEQMWVFNNRNHGDAPRTSELMQVGIYPDDGTTEVLQTIPDPLERYTSYLGDVIVLPGGNLLVAWSPKGHLTELTPDGEVVWELYSEGLLGRISLMPDRPI